MGGKRTFEAVAFRVDFSAILILPFSALVAFATLILAAIAKHPPPRLIWPCAFSTLAAGIMLLRLPELSALGRNRSSGGEAGHRSDLLAEAQLRLARNESRPTANVRNGWKADIQRPTCTITGPGSLNCIDDRSEHRAISANFWADIRGGSAG
jgi:hypothetical protein